MSAPPKARTGRRRKGGDCRLLSAIGRSIESSTRPFCPAVDARRPPTLRAHPEPVLFQQASRRRLPLSPLIRIRSRIFHANESYNNTCALVLDQQLRPSDVRISRKHDGVGVFARSNNSRRPSHSLRLSPSTVRCLFRLGEDLVGNGRKMEIFLQGKSKGIHYEGYENEWIQWYAIAAFTDPFYATIVYLQHV